MADEPNKTSIDYDMMFPFWEKVDTILDGLGAMIQKGTKYLPMFIKETDASYKHRLHNAKFTNLYRDISEGLASKPFQKEVQVREGSASDIIVGVKKKDQNGKDYRSGGLVEDIDGEGNHLHVFLAHTFFMGINNSIDWILVDKKPVPEGATRAIENALGARPYWVHVNALDIISIHTATINTKKEFVHVRIKEQAIIRQGFSEKLVYRIRVFDREELGDGNYAPATWTLWEQRDKDEYALEKEWFIRDSGVVGIGVIPLVPFITGRRKGSSWQFIPPLQDVAELQIKHYQAETNLWCTKEAAAFPMLAGNGVEPETDANDDPVVLEIGPGTVLYAPPSENGSASWQFIEPSSESLKFLASDVDTIERQMREIGRQPLTNESGNLTVVTTAFAASKGNSAVQAWANDLEDAAEMALLLTALWLNDKSEPEVIVYKDFSIDLETDQAPTMIQFLRQNGDISRKSVLREAKRRDWLSPEFDADVDEAELAKEPKPEPEPTPSQPGATE